MGCLVVERSGLLALLLHVLVLGDPEEESDSAANEDDAGYDVTNYLVGSGLLPLFKCGGDGSGSSADVALSVVLVIVLVAGGSGLLTNVTILVAIVVVGMGNGSGFLTYVTIGVAVVVVLVGGLSGELTNVALLIASVVVLVLRSSGSSADVALAVAVVIEGVSGAGRNGLAALGVSTVLGGAAAVGVIISENGYCGHSKQYAKNCQKSRKKGKILLHR